MDSFGIDAISKRNQLIGWLFAIACFMTNLSQLDYFVNLGNTHIMNFPGWIVLALLLPVFINGRIETTHIFKVFYLLVLFLIVAVLALSLSGKDYVHSSIFECVLICTLIYSIGYCYSKYIGKREVDIILLAYVSSSLIVTLSVFFRYFRNVSLSSLQYEYSSKNSLSLIIFTSIIILLEMRTKRNASRIMKLLVLGFLGIVMVLLRSRAVLLGLAICIVYIICCRKVDKRVKKIVYGGGVLLLFFILIEFDLFKKVLDFAVFVGRRYASIDELSSGRLSILKSFPSLIGTHFLDGIGATYFECFPLSSILQFGVLTGLVVIFIAYYPLICSRKLSSNNEYTQMYKLICIGYILNSAFEGLAPIGPGVKCYFMWLFFGIMSSPSSFLREDFL